MTYDNGNSFTLHVPEPPQQPPRVERRFLPALAEALAQWFPELKGRALAVSEVTVTKENVPTLPLAMCAFVRGIGNSPKHSSIGNIDIEDTFVIEFWLEPQRYKKANGTETPFWSYYPYEQIRDTLLNNIVHWEAPNGERIAYRSMVIAADSFAVTLTFGFIAVFQWCPDANDSGDPFKISFNLCIPPGQCLPDDGEVVLDPDTCLPI